MINLLPPEEKKILLVEKKKRLIVILGSLILVFLISLFLILLSVKVNIQGQVEVQKISFSSVEKEFQKSEVNSFKKEIKSINQYFSKLKSFYQSQIYFSGILKQTFEIIPEQISLTDSSFSFQLEGKKKIKVMRVSLSGFAETVDDLVKFKENLEAKENFKEIYFPPSNWVQEDNIDFNVTFKIIL